MNGAQRRKIAPGLRVEGKMKKVELGWNRLEENKCDQRDQPPKWLSPGSQISLRKALVQVFDTPIKFILKREYGWNMSLDLTMKACALSPWLAYTETLQLGKQWKIFCNINATKTKTLCNSFVPVSILMLPFSVLWSFSAFLTRHVSWLTIVYRRKRQQTSFNTREAFNNHINKLLNTTKSQTVRGIEK